MCEALRKLMEPEMNEAIQTAVQEAVEKARMEAKESALRFFQNGVSYELVRVSITSLSDEELQEIYQKAKNG